METLFWVVAAIIFYTYLGYPFVLVFLSIFVKRRIRREDIEPHVTFLIAAYNEEKSIRKKLENTLALDYPKDKLEIIIASDGSTDRTDDIVEEFKDRGVILYRIRERAGKTEARNRAIKLATGEIVVFSDATTIYDQKAIRKMVRNYYDPRVGAVSGRYDYTSSEESSVGLANILFWRYENFVKARQSRLRTLTGMSGCINSFRRELYEPLPRDIIEDLVEPLKIIEKGYRIVFEPEALAVERTTESAQQEFKMRIRVISQGMHGLWFVRRLFNPLKYGVVSFQLFSHKVLRWLMPLFLITLFASNGVLVRSYWVYSVSFALQIAFYVLAGLGLLLQKSKVHFKPLTFPLYFCTLNLAALIALFRFVRNKTISQWETVR